MKTEIRNDRQTPQTGLYAAKTKETNGPELSD
jgi:hypothetical protein